MEVATKDMPILDYSVSQNTLDNVSSSKFSLSGRLISLYCKSIINSLYLGIHKLRQEPLP